MWSQAIPGAAPKIKCTHKNIFRRYKPYLNVFYGFQAPGWAYFTAALGLFLYQSLDAIDGKQARRTNSASPLGELFDHGCDAVSCGKFISYVYGIFKMIAKVYFLINPKRTFNGDCDVKTCG